MAHPVTVSRFVSFIQVGCLSPPAFSTFLKEIHNKITSIGFEDCKVFIHSVDAQSSANGGIIIQVIGEMSNRSEPWKKFVQTFFLAEQPNGYFVLNDIFRFLKEEPVESDEGEPEQATADAEQVSEPPQQDSEPPRSPVAPQPVPLAADIPAPEPVQTASPTPSAAPAEEVPASYEPPVAEPQTNGHAQVEQEAPETPSSAPLEESPTPEPELAPAMESPAPTASPAPPPVSSPAPTQPPAAAATSQPAPAPAPVPAAPKTWANLAATNSKKWGSAVAQESRGTSEAPAASSSTPGSGTQTPVSHHGPGARPQQQPREPHPSYVTATNVSNALCFVKVTCPRVVTLILLSDILQSVQENVTETALRNTLTARFGPIKDLDLVRTKACAFLEFSSVDAARRAILASLPTSQGGEGGIRIDVGDGQQMRITIETRKERGERPPSRPRGGAPVNSDMRGGGFRGRGGGPGRGRGVGTK
jgi:Nuclear transport factor 2 (NTF2) domain/RNA recognition motif. (a.k.a. RRM, RBD, or RNP domain)